MPDRISFASLRPAPASKIRLLGLDQPLDWQTDAAGITTVEIPASARSAPPCRHAFALKFELGAGVPEGK